MAPDIHVNFRLRGIPHDYQSRSEVRELVGRVLPVENGTNLTIHSLAINPTERTSRVATLTFNNIPHPLSDKIRDQWVFDLPRSDSSDDDDAYPRRRQLVFDTHFSGFTPLQHTEEEDCRVDLVALSGLGGHAFGSFKERNGSFMWLRDALTLDIPIARTMIYGYDTSLVRNVSFPNLANLGWALQADLKIIRNSNRGRPIIFISHSLGGLVLKEAIIKMKERNAAEDCELLQSTSAILFFGVPHEGMAIESLVPLVGGQPSRALLESLGRNSELLHRLQDDFKRAFGAVSPKVVSYFETEKSPTAQKEGDIWKLTGPLEVLVDPASAVCGSKDQHPINRNHSEMVKYTSHYDEIYTRVRATLERLVSGTQILFDDSTRGSLFLSDQQQECLKSFSFAEQDQRCKEIRVARETCEWLRDNANYRSWISKPRGLLWIKGNPGAGKSFLMKSAYTTTRHWMAGELVVSFFFHGRGVPLQRTPIGLFRALLSSTLAFFPEFLSYLVALFQEREKTFGSYRQDRWAWSQRELEDFLTRLLSQETKTRPIVIFVDALDECGRDSARQLLSYFKDLMADVMQEGGNLKICFSSGHYPILGLDVVPTVIVEEQNGRDIRCVIRKQLKEIQPEEERQQLEKEILMKAQGGFQWAVMVASNIVDDYAIGINAEDLRDRIKAIPHALKQLYAEILNSIPDSEKHQTAKLFEWVLSAGRPLVAQELREALVTDKDMTCATVSDLRHHRDWTGTVEMFERRVKHLSRGLIEFQTREVCEQDELNGEDFNREAQFIHQSVPDFLQDGGMSRIGVYSITIPLLAGPCHFQLAISCIKYLMLNEVLAATTASRSSLSEMFPLAPYAVRFFFYHIREAETQGLSQPDLLSLVQWKPQSQTMAKLARIWKILDPNYTHTPNGRPLLGGTPLHVLVTLGSMSAFKLLLQEGGAEVDGRDPEGNSPLLLAIREGRENMALMLVHEFTRWKYQSSSPQGYAPTESDKQRKAPYIDVNSENNDGDTPLTVALKEKATNVALALIDAGANLKCFGSESAIVFYAIRTKNKRLLLKAIEKNFRLDGSVYFALGELSKDEIVLLDYLSVLLKAGANTSKGPEFENNLKLLNTLVEDESYESNWDIYDPLDIGEEAIHLASRQGQKRAIGLLLSFGASASTHNASDKNPLGGAAEMEHEDAAKLLFRKGPETTTKSVLEVSTPDQKHHRSNNFSLSETENPFNPSTIHSIPGQGSTEVPLEDHKSLRDSKLSPMLEGSARSPLTPLTPPNELSSRHVDDVIQDNAPYNKLGYIEEVVMTQLSHQEHVSILEPSAGTERHNRSSLRKASLLVLWDPKKSFHCQHSVMPDFLGDVATISGSISYAYATTCREYLQRFWPDTPDILVAQLQIAISDGEAHMMLDDGGHLSIELSGMFTDSLRIRICASAKLLVELVQQLCWIGAAIRCPRDSITTTENEVHIERDRSTIPVSDFIVSYTERPPHTVARPCWLELFDKPAIAYGFPIPERGSEVGLEIPIGLLAINLEARYAVEYEGGVVVKGFSSMVYPTKKNADMVQWHVVTSGDPELRLSYREVLDRCQDRVLVEDLGLAEVLSTRAIVGWCGRAETLLGSERVNYTNTGYSGASDAGRRLKFAGGTLGFQQLGVGQADFGLRTRVKCHYQRPASSYRKTISAAETTPIILYDTVEKRAWLLPTSDVLLHIAQARHLKDPTNDKGEHIQLFSKDTSTCSAKESLLRDADNLLSESDDYRLRNMILDIWALLEFLLDQNVKHSTSSENDLRGTMRDILCGFEFQAVVDNRSPFRLKSTYIQKSSGGWTDLAKDIDALVLFANGFGDLILPSKYEESDILCSRYRTLPKEEDMLATTVKVMADLYTVAGCPHDHSYLTSSSKLQWHTTAPDALFSPCNTDPSQSCKCRRLSQIIPKSAIGKVIRPTDLNAHAAGAVIFGKSGKLLKDLAEAELSKSGPRNFYNQPNRHIEVHTTVFEEGSDMEDEISDAVAENDTDCDTGNSIFRNSPTVTPLKRQYVEASSSLASNDANNAISGAESFGNDSFQPSKRLKHGEAGHQHTYSATNPTEVGVGGSQRGQRLRRQWRKARGDL